uniref:Uncharacterized protein n=1 Tax=Timema monikensis TaxID=170555 RepID=A0A7R9EHT1_9NEOP|nr:unnamed protein product [Timema monikensis]
MSTRRLYLSLFAAIAFLNISLICWQTCLSGLNSESGKKASRSLGRPGSLHSPRGEDATLTVMIQASLESRAVEKQVHRAGTSHILSKAQPADKRTRRQCIDKFKNYTSLSKRDEVYPHLCEGRVESYFGKTTLITSDRDSNLDSPVTNSLIYCQSNTLDHATTEAYSTNVVTGVL